MSGRTGWQGRDRRRVRGTWHNALLRSEGRSWRPKVSGGVWIWKSAGSDSMTVARCRSGRTWDNRNAIVGSRAGSPAAWLPEASSCSGWRAGTCRHARSGDASLARLDFRTRVRVSDSIMPKDVRPTPDMLISQYAAWPQIQIIHLKWQANRLNLHGYGVAQGAPPSYEVGCVG